MSKRLTKKKPERRARRPRRAARVVSARPNRYHTFLKRLHSGGRSNMYGAIPYLMHAFALDREAAFRVVCECPRLADEPFPRVCPGGRPPSVASFAR